MINENKLCKIFKNLQFLCKLEAEKFDDCK